MSTISATRPRTNRKSKKLKFWPSIRFIITVGFFILIGGNLWTGSTCAVDIGPLEIACPLGVAQLIAASRLVVPGLLIAGIMGREGVYCPLLAGWARWWGRMQIFFLAPSAWNVYLPAPAAQLN